MFFKKERGVAMKRKLYISLRTHFLFFFFLRSGCFLSFLLILNFRFLLNYWSIFINLCFIFLLLNTSSSSSISHFFPSSASPAAFSFPLCCRMTIGTRRSCGFTLGVEYKQAIYSNTHRVCIM